jgi:hypothetical protein
MRVRVPCVAVRARVLAALCATALSGCLQLEDFAEPSLVDRPRVLAMTAEPPEIAPGEESRLTVLVAGASEVEVSWRACGGFNGVFGGGAAQYGEGDEDEGCGGGFAVPLTAAEDDAAQAVLPAALTRGLFENLDVAATILGGALPEGTVERVREQVGLPFLIEATVIADGKRIRAVKRVLISEQATPHQNPPPPHFLFGELEVQGASTTHGACAAVDGSTPFAVVDDEIELAPLALGEDGTEDWVEPYVVIDARGDLQSRTERAFYSWFSTDGAFDSAVTKSPLRNQLWRTPREPGCYPLWLVVRDGHGGSSACELRVAVGERDACAP